jgi:glycosyltransferase involved in cell wall biosynthesis
MILSRAAIAPLQIPEPLVSVVIYVKDACATIEKAIVSVLAQPWQRIETIVVDGASRDGTTEILRRYESRLAVLISEPDEGPVFAANKGLARATGDIVMFLMGDDWLEDDAVGEIARAFVAHPTAAIVSSGARIVEEDGAGAFRIAFERHGHDNDLTLDNVLGMPLAAARYWRRDWMTRIGFLDTALPYSHDRDWFVRSLLLGAEAAVIDRILYTYRRHPGSATLHGHSKAIPHFLAEHVSVAERWIAMAGDDSVRERLERWRRAQLAEAMLLAVHQRRCGDAIAWLARAIGTAPRAVIDAAALAVSLRRSGGASAP